jgi:hypothetical protein
MSRGFSDNNKDVDSEEAEAHVYRQNFLAKMEEKLAYKESLLNTRA